MLKLSTIWPEVYHATRYRARGGGLDDTDDIARCVDTIDRSIETDVEELKDFEEKGKGRHFVNVFWWA